MMDDPQPELLPEPLPPTAPPPPPRDPFWSYTDLFLFAILAIPSMLAGILGVQTAMWLLHIRTQAKALTLVPGQFIGYAILFTALAGLFRLQYGKPFWHALGWREFRLPFPTVLAAGVATGFAVASIALAIGIDDRSNPMRELLSDPVSLWVAGLFAITLGPMFEELAFRGLVQPLLVRSLGAVAGVIATAIPFGLLHFQQYGNSWRHALVITCAGACFGWMRQATGSTRASTLMHAAYNSLFFFALLAQRKALPHSW